MDYDIEVHELPTRPTAMSRYKIHPHDVGATIGQEADRLAEVLGAAGAQPTGPVYARYHLFTDDEVDLEVGYPVEAPLVTDDLEMGALPGGRAAVAIHWGDYRGLPQAFEVLGRWVSENATGRAAPWEVYWTDPASTPVEQWKTELIWPIE